jgi:putative tricarboxylic transport membrane protein
VLSLKKENIISGALIVLLGIYVYWTSSGFGLKGLSPDPLGPAFYPKMLGIGFIVLGLLLIILSTRIKEEATLKERFFNSGNMKILIIIGLGILYYLTLLKIGFIIATALFIIAIMIVTGERLWWKIGLTSLFVSFGLFFLFSKILKIMLPLGFGL